MKENFGKSLTQSSRVFLQVLKHLHKKLKNVSRKSELSKKKVGGKGRMMHARQDIKVWN